jgi:hypothetical protein
MSEEITEEAAPMIEWAVWRGKNVPVWDHLPPAWRWRVLELVDAFN